MPTLVLFDLDGTLVDSKPGIERCAAYALAHLGLEPLGDDQLAEFIGPPLATSFAQLGLDDRLVDEAVRAYRAEYEARGLYEFSVFAGIESALGQLSERGARLGVATSKLTSLAREVLTAAGLAHYFEHVAGAELDGSRPDKTSVMAHSLD